MNEGLYYVLIFLGIPAALALGFKVIWFVFTGEWPLFPGVESCIDGRADIC